MRCCRSAAARSSTPTTRADLAGHNVVFLDVSLGEAAKRVGLGVARPLLLGNVRTQLSNLMEARRPLYVEVAKLTVTTDGRTPEEIADEILELGSTVG